MQIIEKNISDIQVYENNPRKNDEAIEPLAKSIKEFGFKIPIIIDKDNVIIAGHTRYKAAQLLNLKTVPCIVANDLDEEKIKLFRLADNKVAEKAYWDFALLKTELETISECDMEQLGFIPFEGINIDVYTPPDDEEEAEVVEPKKKELYKCPHCGEMVEV